MRLFERKSFAPFMMCLCALICCVIPNPCKAVDPLNPRETAECLRIIKVLSYQTQDKILEKSWLFLNETDKVKVIENIEALEGDIWTTDEVLRLATKKLPGPSQTNDFFTHCVMALLTHHTMVIWNNMNEEYKIDILLYIASTINDRERLLFSRRCSIRSQWLKNVSFVTQVVGRPCEWVYNTSHTWTYYTRTKNFNEKRLSYVQYRTWKKMCVCVFVAKKSHMINKKMIDGKEWQSIFIF